MAIVYDFDTVIQNGKEKGMTVREAFEKDNRFVFETIKKWSADKVRNKEFSDDVLAAAHITKRIVPGSVTIQQEEVFIPRSVVFEDGKVRRCKRQSCDDEPIDMSFYYGPDYNEGAKDENQEWGDGFDAEEDNW